MTLLGALDVGSNTIRLLVARPNGQDLDTVLDLSEFVRLGMGVAETGKLDPARLERGVRVVGRFAATARSAGVQELAAVGTSALRDASNGPDFVARVAAETGVRIKIVDGETEARLTFLGATLGRPLERPAVTIDVGGGSAEIVAAGPDGVLWVRALPLGSGRMTEEFFQHDPPAEQERAALTAHVHAMLRELPPLLAPDAIVTGGSARRIPLLLQRGVPATLEPQEVERVMALLSIYPSSQIAERYAVDLDRARVLAAGVQVVQAITAFYGAERITITDNGIRQGMIIELLRAEGRPQPFPL